MPAEGIISSSKEIEEILNSSNLSFENLKYLAKEVSANSWSPYSHFPVGAVVVGIDQSKKPKVFSGTNVMVVFFDEKIIGIDLPAHVELLVSETPPGVRGDTAAGNNKPATLETGAQVQVPFFVNIGDVVRIDTRTNQYIDRVKA